MGGEGGGGDGGGEGDGVGHTLKPTNETDVPVTICGFEVAAVNSSRYPSTPGDEVTVSVLVMVRLLAPAGTWNEHQPGTGGGEGGGLGGGDSGGGDGMIAYVLESCARFAAAASAVSSPS